MNRDDQLDILLDSSENDDVQSNTFFFFSQFMFIRVPYLIITFNLVVKEQNNLQGNSC